MTHRSHRAALCVFVALFAGAPVSVGQIAEGLGRGVTRFHKDDAAKAAALPSMALLGEPKVGPAPQQISVRPAFSVEGERQMVTVPIPEGTSLYGTGGVTGPLLRNGRVIECWNTDAYGYADPSPSLYQSHPWVLAVRPDGTAFGVLADTTWRTEVDLRADIVFRAQGPAYPVIIIERDHPLEVVQALADLTGKIEMPPKWAIGYHQCRYSYYPDERVREVAGEFRERAIPCDVIWMDIDYMDGFRCFTFDPEYFPDPKALNNDLHEQGFRTVWMIDPGIKAEPGYFVYGSGSAANAWVKQADGVTDYQGEVWPGMCVFPDYTNKSVREWWAGLYRDFMATGIDGVWNDMNEPAVFNVKSKTMPEDNLHRADSELGGPGPHARFHNVYGMLMVKATREGVMAANPEKRPFVLSRANYIGGQRYAAMWTGDNSATWAHMEESIPMALGMGLSGQPFAGPDIGGFAGNGDGKLFARWMGIGSLLPFARGHTGKDSIDKEPWAFGPDVEATSRAALVRRYRLMPYLYTLFWEAHQKGSPIVRPVFFADPKDPVLRSEDDAFLLGADLLIAPQLVPDNNRVLTIPSNYTGNLDMGDSGDPHLPELIVRAGAIVPLGPSMQYVDEIALDPLTLVVNLDENGKASGVLYEDEGEGWGFRDGEYRLSRYTAERQGDEVIVRRASMDGKMAPPERGVRLRILANGREYKGSGRDGQEIRVRVPAGELAPVR